MNTLIETGLGIYLDLKKAFDTVNRDILLYKSYNYVIRNTVNDWFKCYLSNRFQYTIVNDFVSATEEVSCGVP